MNRLLPTAALLAALAFQPFAAGAAPPPVGALPQDVPAKHWAAGSVGRVLQHNILGRAPDGRFRGDQPVTRYELAVALDRFVRYIEAGRKPLHVETVPVTFPTTKAPPAVRQAMQHLVSNGFLPPTSSLIGQDGHKAVTAKELTDALAAVTIRLSNRAEAPNKE